MVNDVGREVGQQRLHGLGVSDVCNAGQQPGCCIPQSGPTQQAQVVEWCFCDVDGEHLLGSPFKRLHDEFRTDGASAAGDQYSGASDLLCD